MNHYEVLQVRQHAEPEVVEKAYKALCMKYHPDRVPPAGRARATHRMQAINMAYEVLSDPMRRAEYDRRLPSKGTSGGWELFLDDGLVGLFTEWMVTRE